MTMGLGQGLARGPAPFLYGFLGGLIGGLLGGLLFDPIDMLLLRGDKPSASDSRWVGFGVIGAVVGLMIGIVERLARDAWLRHDRGAAGRQGIPGLQGRDADGLLASSEIYLFNDPAVAAQHAIIRATGDIYEIENTCRENPACLNGRPSSVRGCGTATAFPSAEPPSYSSGSGRTNVGARITRTAMRRP